MSSDPRPGESARAEETDEAISTIVRDLVAGWTMPPRRLGARTWRDRVAARPRRSMPHLGGSGWLGRLGRFGRAASTAVVLTVALALVAVWLGASRSPSIGTGPTGAPFGSPGLGSGASAAGTSPAVPATPTPSPLPPFALFGQPLSGRVVAQFGGTYRSIDLADGSVTTGLFADATYDTKLFRLPDGGFVCACVTWSSADYVAGTMVVDARILDQAGQVLHRYPVETLVGDRDPGGGQTQGQGALATADLAPDGRTLYVAWGYRASPVWHFGIDVVDLSTGKTVQTERLDDRPSIVGGDSAPVWLPALRVAPDGSGAMLTMTGTSLTASATHVLATLDGNRIVSTATLPEATGTVGGNYCRAWGAEGWATRDAYYAVCTQPLTYVLFDRSGRQLATTDLGASGGLIEPVLSGSDAIDRAAGLLYHWNAFGRTLTRLDLATGRVTGTVTAGQTGAAQPDGIEGLAWSVATWLAPTASAKTFLMPGLALSPDGSRVYAIGVSTTPGGASTSGSSGVDVFDARSMTQVDHWAPIADLVSIATSSDGRYVYVAGAPGADASGQQTNSPASLAVYDAASGTLRLVAGDLGSDYLALLP